MDNRNTKLIESVNPKTDIKTERLENQMGDATWVFTDLKTINEYTKKPTLHNMKFLESIKPHHLWIQTLILGQYPYTDKNFTLAYSFSTLNSYHIGCNKIIHYLNIQKGDKSKLRNWQLDDIADFIRYSIHKPSGGIFVHSTVLTLVRILTNTHELRHEIDGLSMPVPTNFLTKVLKPEIQKQELNYTEWKTGGSLGLMPYPIATLLIADAIKTIRSKKTQLLIVYLQAGKSNLVKAHIFNTELKHTTLNNFINYKYGNNKKRLSNQNKVARNNRLEFVRSLHLIDPNLKEFPFKSLRDISNNVKHIFGACITILLATTAMRMSELGSVRANQVEYKEIFQPQTNNWEVVNASMYSQIIKSGGGIIAKRGLTPIGVEVFNLINLLSFTDKIDNNFLLFEVTFNNLYLHQVKRFKPRGVGLLTLSNWFKSYYNDFVNRSHESIKITYPHATPHNLRHFKAAVALRRFDGDVEGAIHQEFRHSNYHTRSYVINKLNDQEISFVKKEFVQEMVKRILVNETNDRWIGPGVNKLRSAAEKYLSNQPIELLSIEEFANFFESIDDDIHSLTLHSYGGCMVLTDQIQSAKCGTRDNIVQTGEARSEVCYGCSNLALSKISHEHELKLNLRRWQAFVDDPIFSSFKLNTEASNVIKRLESLEIELRDASHE